MIYVVLSFSFFMLGVILHLLWCRWKGGRELRVLSFLILAMVNLILYILTERVLLSFYLDGLPEVWNLQLEMASVVLYALFIPFYLVFYYSVNIDSPSRTVLLILEKNKGLTYQELKSQVTDEQFIVSRLKDLVDNRCVAFDGKEYRLLAHMTAIGRMLNLYQKITGRPAGG